MAEEKSKNQGNIKLNPGSAQAGLNLDSSVSQVGKGKVTYALNACVENFDDNSVSYQNELGNELCLTFPTGYKLIGEYYIPEKRKHIFFLSNSKQRASEIGYMDNNNCKYQTLINAPCLNFDIKHPIPKIVHRITNCTTEIYWTDGNNSRRYLDIENIPYKLTSGTPSCDPVYGNELDCNQLKIQPNFSIPQLDVTKISSVGDLTSGTYQFGIQYSDINGNELTSYYSITNPIPIADKFNTTVNFNYPVGKSIIVGVSNLDLTGQFQHFNIAVIKTINNVSSYELIGTYNIEESFKEITYSGTDKTAIQLSASDIFEKFPYYDIANDVTAVQDIIVWNNLKSIDRINYQSIASNVTLGWETYRIPPEEDYSNEVNATNLRGYMRDEVYAFEIVFLLKNGKQTDGFHIPGRSKNSNESYPDVPDSNDDFVGDPDYQSGDLGYSPWWKIYNTASLTGFSLGYDANDEQYKGPYQHGQLAYWESKEEYPCNSDLWGSLAGEKIRHHKFPDVSISPIIENDEINYGSNKIIPSMQDNAVFPIGIRIDNSQINGLIQSSELTSDQKDDIIGYKIVRGNRSTNRSIVAKGMLRNVNKYTRDEEEYYYPNYPYNDLTDDPFILANNNAFANESKPWLIYLPVNSENTEPGRYGYTSILNGKSTEGVIQVGEILEICSITRPTNILGNKMVIGPGNYDVYEVESRVKGMRLEWYDPFNDENINGTNFSEVFVATGDPRSTVVVDADAPPPYAVNTGGPSSRRIIDITIEEIGNNPPTRDEVRIGFQLGTSNRGNSRRSPLDCSKEKKQPSIQSQKGEDVTYRQIFNSPETSFGQPFLGDVLKLESVMFGAGKAHFVDVKDNAKYKLLSKEAQIDALNSSEDIANITDPFNAGIMFTAFQAYLTIYINGITRKNYGMSFNSRANYDYSLPIDNNVSGGIKQRDIDFSRYVIPGVQSLGKNELDINNWNRETSVFIKTKDKRKDGASVSAIPFPNETPSLMNSGTSLIEDNSRFTISEGGSCGAPGKEKDISVVSYYASMKNIVPSQWGQIYSYETIDTGYQSLVNNSKVETVFGGDVFISRFTYKTKLPFFIDNRVSAPDDSDIFYDEIGNIGYPKYWHSSRSILEDFDVESDPTVPMRNIISYKAHNFDCPNDPSSVPVGSGSARTFYDGYIYMFAYGIPNFYCESTYNTDLRQAFNNNEGDFWPHVSSGIPDDWFQEKNVPIAQDNTYYYNVTFSKQNKENKFTHLPPNWNKDFCLTNFPFRAIYSDPAIVSADNKVNNWLVYRALSFHDFPQNYGNLISLDGIQNKAILARFENKSLLYNNLLTIDTSNPQAAYIGNSKLFEGSPPIDFAETDLGYVGSQNKFLLKIPQGQVTIDSKRGQVFLIAGKAVDLTSFNSGVNKFMKDELPFHILRTFPNVETDNNFNGVGLHGVYDSRFERIIITKLDYSPLSKDIKYNKINDSFYITDSLGIETIIFLEDQKYFCNKSWTMSFDFNIKSWVSFHSYIPNYYIADNAFFYSGKNGCCELNNEVPNFEVIVGEVQPPVIITTTTTTTSPPLFTTTTTTTQAADCDLSGGSFILNYCELAGTAVIIVPPTTTTTICSRPSNLYTGLFLEGYERFPNAAVISTGSSQEACNAAFLVDASQGSPTPIDLPIHRTVQYSFEDGLNIGTIVYEGISTACVFPPDGWYSTESSYSGSGYVFKLESGTIIEIRICSQTTTTTTTITPTTTTTTTTSGVCNEYTVQGPRSLVYIDCLGNEKYLNVPSGNTTSVCASIAIPGAVLNGSCPI
tara:strand:- start:566 stop:5911 length:5346 start_codon:yes stop_codon:yes gene_type:complete